jgi:hypothetical protein
MISERAAGADERCEAASKMDLRSSLIRIAEQSKQSIRARTGHLYGERAKQPCTGGFGRLAGDNILCRLIKDERGGSGKC